MKEKGFTLVELLAVIVILAIVLAIAVPSITGIIENVTINAFEQDAKMIIKSINYKSLMNDNFKATDITKENITELLGVGNKNYNSIEVSKDAKGNPFVKIIGINKWEGLTACGTYTDMEVGSDIECELPPPPIIMLNGLACGNKFKDTRPNALEEYQDYEYETVQIGNQCWMAENLKYTGEGENSCLGESKWSSDVSLAKGCMIFKESDLGSFPDQEWAIGEVLYQWKAAMNWDVENPSDATELEGTQGLCPPGWHVPTDAEWKTLEKKLGMEQAQADATGYRGTNEGYKLKSTTNWDENGNGDNSSGFNAKPAGYRDASGTLSLVGYYGSWWSSSSDGTDFWRRGLFYDNSYVYRTANSQANGYSVRCLAGT